MRCGQHYLSRHTCTTSESRSSQLACMDLLTKRPASSWCAAALQTSRAALLPDVEAGSAGGWGLITLDDDRDHIDLGSVGLDYGRLELLGRVELPFIWITPANVPCSASAHERASFKWSQSSRLRRKWPVVRRGHIRGTWAWWQGATCVRKGARRAQRSAKSQEASPSRNLFTGRFISYPRA